jgi:hypothetical protein
VKILKTRRLPESRRDRAGGSRAVAGNGAFGRKSPEILPQSCFPLKLKAVRSGACGNQVGFWRWTGAGSALVFRVELHGS